MGGLCRDNTKTSLAANRTRESRPSGMRGGLAETWAMGELGTHLAIERASVGNSPPKVIRAALLPDGGRRDAQPGPANHSRLSQCFSPPGRLESGVHTPTRAPEQIHPIATPRAGRLDQ